MKCGVAARRRAPQQARLIPRRHRGDHRCERAGKPGPASAAEPDASIRRSDSSSLLTFDEGRFPARNSCAQNRCRRPPCAVENRDGESPVVTHRRARRQRAARKYRSVRASPSPGWQRLKNAGIRNAQFGGAPLKIGQHRPAANDREPQVRDQFPRNGQASTGCHRC